MERCSTVRPCVFARSDFGDSLMALLRSSSDLIRIALTSGGMVPKPFVHAYDKCRRRYEQVAPREFTKDLQVS